MSTTTLPMPRRIERALGELGYNADEVAKTLQMKGIQGCTSDDFRCAVAEYLRAECQPPRNEHREDVSVGAGTAYLYATGVVIPLPDAVADFVEMFDQGLYPNLIKHEEVTTR